MDSCCTQNGTDRFFSKYARRYAKRFRRKGLDKPSKKLVDALCRIGIQGLSVLDIGCGVGGVHLTLLGSGASSAQGVELSAGMLDAAGNLSRELGLESHVEYIHGDFVGLDGVIKPADVVIMDKVICCHPDRDLLLGKAGARTRRLLAISYPKDALMARIVFGSMSRLGQLLNWSFHPYYHEPAKIDRFLERIGLREKFRDATLIWQVKVFSKDEVGGARPIFLAGETSNRVAGLRNLRPSRACGFPL